MAVYLSKMAATMVGSRMKIAFKKLLLKLNNAVYNLKIMMTKIILRTPYCK